MRDCVETPGSVKVIHGANDGIFDVAGSTVATVQEMLADAFNLPIEAFAYIKGKIVGEEYRLKAEDTVVFAIPCGLKGANDHGNDPDFKRIRTPFPYSGGKSRVAREVWNRFGDVKNYIEPFFGGGAVLLNRPVVGPNRLETVNDIDSLLANFWRAVKYHPRKLAEIADYPVSEVDLHARHPWLMKHRDRIAEMMRKDVAWCDPKVAAWWVWGISQWIGGGWCASNNPSQKMPHHHGRGVHRLSNQRPSLDSRGVHRKSSPLPEYYESLSNRLKGVRILSGDWLRLVTTSTMTRYGITGVFLDPPYTAESGRMKNLYAKDDLQIGHQVRDWAVANGENPKLRIALCGYEGEYQMPQNWSEYQWKASGGRNGHRERIWFSPNCLQ
jgi:DNA adenine methylase